MVNWSHCRETQGGGWGGENSQQPIGKLENNTRRSAAFIVDLFVVCVLAVCVGPTSRTLSLMVPSPSWSNAWNAPAGRGERERKGPSTVLRGAGMDDTAQHNMSNVSVLLPGLCWGSFNHHRAVRLALCLLPPVKNPSLANHGRPL